MTIETVLIDPTCSEAVRSAARIDECSGASCRPALRLAGLIAPRPAPTTKAPPASHAYGETPATGATASSSIPTVIAMAPTYKGSRWPVRRSSSAATTENTIAAAPCETSNVAAPSASMP